MQYGLVHFAVKFVLLQSSLVYLTSFMGPALSYILLIVIFIILGK